MHIGNSCNKQVEKKPFPISRKNEQKTQKYHLVFFFQSSLWHDFFASIIIKRNSFSPTFSLSGCKCTHKRSDMFFCQLLCHFFEVKGLRKERQVIEEKTMQQRSFVVALFTFFKPSFPQIFAHFMTVCYLFFPFLWTFSLHESVEYISFFNAVVTISVF